MFTFAYNLIPLQASLEDATETIGNYSLKHTKTWDLEEKRQV